MPTTTKIDRYCVNCVQKLIMRPDSAYHYCPKCNKKYTEDDVVAIKLRKDI